MHKIIAYIQHFLRFTIRIYAALQLQLFRRIFQLEKEKKEKEYRAKVNEKNLDTAQ